MFPPPPRADRAPRRPRPLLSVAPVTVPAPRRTVDLQVRVTAPLGEGPLPVVVFSHGHGPSRHISSLYGYAPVADAWAARGFAVLQPTHLDSATLGLRGADTPEAPLYWRSRAQDVSLLLDHLDLVELQSGQPLGRLGRDRIAVAGHSMGGHTASLLLGARPVDPEFGVRVGLRDERIRAGVLLAAPGRGGDALQPEVSRNYPILADIDFGSMVPPTLVVAGDEDHARHLNVIGAAWQADAYHLSSGEKALLEVHGGEHGLGGIAGYDAAETTDEDPERSSMVLGAAAAFLERHLEAGDGSWGDFVSWISGDGSSRGTLHSRPATS